MSRTSSTATSLGVTSLSMLIISGNAGLTTSSNPTDWDEVDDFARETLTRESGEMLEVLSG